MKAKDYNMGVGFSETLKNQMVDPHIIVELLQQQPISGQ